MSIINPVLGPPTDVSNCNSHIWVPAAFCQLTNMVILEFCNVAPVLIKVSQMCCYLIAIK